LRYFEFENIFELIVGGGGTIAFIDMISSLCFAVTWPNRRTTKRAWREHAKGVVLLYIFFVELLYNFM